LTHVVTKWLGYSPNVAVQRYLMSRDHHFADVVNGGAAAGATSSETPAEGRPGGRDRGTRPRKKQAALTIDGPAAVTAAGRRAKNRPPWPWMAGRP
jgi:hypothetical protein